MRCATAKSAPRRQAVEVDLAQGRVDEAPLGVGVEHLARDLLGRDQGQLDDLAADLLDELSVLRLDRLLVLLEPALEIGTGLATRPPALGRAPTPPPAGA